MSAAPSFTLARPRDVEAAVALRAAHADSRFIAGGTDLIVNLRHGLGAPPLLVDLTGIEGFAGIEPTGSGLRIGAGTTIAAIARSDAVRQTLPALAQAAESIGAPGHRVSGTLGGNLCLDTRCIYYNQSQWWRRANAFCLKHEGDTCHVAPQGNRCHAAFSGDLAPALLTFDASVEIASPRGTRRMPLADLYREDGRAHLTLASDELLVAAHIPSPAPGTQSAYGKVRLRDAIDFPLAGVAVALRSENGMLAALKIAVTGANSRPFLLGGCDVLVGRPAEGVLADIERFVQKQVQPMRTTLAPAQYRRIAAAALARRLVAQLAGGAS